MINVKRCRALLHSVNGTLRVKLRAFGLRDSSEVCFPVRALVGALLVVSQRDSIKGLFEEYLLGVPLRSTFEEYL